MECFNIDCILANQWIYMFDVSCCAGDADENREKNEKE